MRYRIKIALLTLGTVVGFACGTQHLLHGGARWGHGRDGGHCHEHRDHGASDGQDQKANHDGAPGAG